MNDDATLLRRYAGEGSETAFAELVRRHVDLVYGAALRRTGGDHQRAAEVAQQVFTQLARHARRLSQHAVLGAWLHTATRNAALNLMISENRRQAREAEALALQLAAAAEAAPPDWERLRPLLDEAIDELPEADRAAVVLRFLERRAFAEIGAALRVSDDAARVRTDRALDKLRVALARRGITSTAAALGALVSSQSLVAAPAGLAAAVATQAMAAGGVGLTATALTFFMSTKLIGTAALSALIAFLIGTQWGAGRAADVAPSAGADAARQAQTIATLRQENKRLGAEVAALGGDVANLKAMNSELTAKRSAASPAPGAAPTTKDVTLGMARWEVQQAALNNLRQIAAARDQYVIENGRLPGSIHDLVGRKSFIKRVQTVDGEDYSALSMNPADPLTVTTPNGITVTYDPTADANTTHPDFPAEVLRVRDLQRLVQDAENRAVGAYRAAHDGKNPPNEQAVLPYFTTPKEGADFMEYLEAKKAAGQ